MSINLANLVQKIVVNSSGVKAGLGSSAGQIDKFASGMGGVGRKMTMGLTVPIIAFGVAGVQAASDLDSSLRKVNSLTGLTGEAGKKSFSKFQAQVSDLSHELGMAQTELSDGLYQALSAGVPANNAIDFMRVSSKAAIAGVTDTKTVVDGLTTVINSFGLKTTDAQQVADMMFQTVKDGKTEFADLSGALYNVAPSAAAAGVKFSEVSAALSQLTSRGVPTSVATTQIRAGIDTIVKGSPALEKTFKKAGFASGSAALKQIGYAKSMQVLRDSTKGNNGELLHLLRRTEAYQGALAVTGENQKSFNNFLNNTKHSAGAATTAYEEINKGAKRQQEIFKTTMQNLSIQAGKALLPFVNKAMDTVTKVIAAFDKLPGPMKGIIAKAVLGVAILGPALVITSKAILTIGKAGQTLVAGGKGLSKFLGIAKNADGARGGLAKLGPLIKNLGKGGKVAFKATLTGAKFLGKGTIKGGSVVFKTAVTGAKATAGVLGPVAKSLGSISKVAGSGLLKGLMAAGRGFKFVAVAVRVMSMALLTNPFTYIVLAIVLVAFLIYKNWDKIKKYLVITWNWIKNTAAIVWNALKAFFVAFWNGVVAIFMGVFNVIKTIVMTYFNVYKFIIMTALHVIMAVVKFVWNAIKTVFTTVFNVIRTVITTAFNFYKMIITTVLNVIRTVVSTVWNGIKTVINGVLNVIRAIVSAVFNGIRVAITTAVNIAHAVVTTAMNIIKGAINGVKTVAGALGDAFSAGFGVVKSVVKGAWDAIQPILGWISGAIGKVMDVVGSITGGVGKAVSAVGNFFGGGKATGGPVVANRSYLVGEKGPEIFTPQHGGKIIPNKSIQGGGGGVGRVTNVYLTVNNPKAERASDTLVRRTQQIRVLGVAG